MSNDCGCCEGTHGVTPLPTANRPGLEALTYRIGTHSSFLETMLARLSTLCDDTPERCRTDAGNYPLRERLTTRKLDDPSIAVLDAWATVADVLTFYQERIANEGFLRTAVQRRSIHKLARLVGYTPRPGLAADVHLAFEVDQPPSQTPTGASVPAAHLEVFIPRGTAVQSTPTPGTDEKPQTFETSQDLRARPQWNRIRPRQTKPQSLTIGSVPNLTELYFEGVGLRLRKNDQLAVVLPSRRLPFVLRIEDVEEQGDQQRTRVEVQTDELTKDALFEEVQQFESAFYRAIDASLLSESQRAELREMFRKAVNALFQDARAQSLADAEKNVRENLACRTILGIASGGVPESLAARSAEIHEDIKSLEEGVLEITRGPTVGTLSTPQRYYRSLTQLIERLRHESAGQDDLAISLAWTAFHIRDLAAISPGVPLNIGELAVAAQPKVPLMVAQAIAGTVLQEPFGIVPLPDADAVAPTYDAALTILTGADQNPTLQRNDDTPLALSDMTLHALQGELNGLKFTADGAAQIDILLTIKLHGAASNLAAARLPIVVSPAGNEEAVSLIPPTPVFAEPVDDAFEPLRIAEGLTLPELGPGDEWSLRILIDGQSDDADHSLSYDGDELSDGLVTWDDVFPDPVADPPTKEKFQQRIEQLLRFDSEWQKVNPPAHRFRTLRFELRTSDDITTEPVSTGMREVVLRRQPIPAEPAELAPLLEAVAAVTGLLSRLHQSPTDFAKHLALPLGGLIELARAKVQQGLNEINADFFRDLEDLGLDHPPGESHPEERLAYLERLLTDLKAWNPEAVDPATLFDQIEEAIDAENERYERLVSRVVERGAELQKLALTLQKEFLRRGKVTISNYLKLLSSEAEEIALEILKFLDVYVSEIEKKIKNLEEATTPAEACPSDVAPLAAYACVLQLQASDEPCDPVELDDVPPRRLFPVLEPLSGKQDPAEGDPAAILESLSALVKRVLSKDKSRPERRLQQDLPAILGQLNALLGQTPQGELADVAADLGQLFATASDLIPQILNALRPDLRDFVVTTLRQHRNTQAERARVFVLRTAARVFGWNSPQPLLSEGDAVREILNGVPGDSTNALLQLARTLVTSNIIKLVPVREMPDGQDHEIILTAPEAESPARIHLDSAYSGVAANDVIVIERDDRPEPIATFVNSSKRRPRTAYGLSGDTTEIELAASWWETDKFQVIRTTQVFCEPEELMLAERPLEDYLSFRPDGNLVIELEGLYVGLDTNRPLMLEGVVRRDESDAGQRSELLKLIAVEHKIDNSLYGDRFHTQLVLAVPPKYEYRREDTGVRANVVAATHGATQDEVLGSGDSRKEFQKFQLKNPRVTFTPAPNASGVESSLTLRVNEVDWREETSLSTDGIRTESFVAQTNNEGLTTVILGSRENDGRPPTGIENVRATYRSGLGISGNVAAGRIDQLVGAPLGVKGVLNPLPARGGTDPESRDMARERAHLGTVLTERIVSVQDYTDFALRYAGIGKASASKLQGRVHLTVAGATPDVIDPESQLYHNFQQALRLHGDPQQQFVLHSREVALLMIVARISIDPAHQWTIVRERITRALLARFSYDESRFGQDVLLSDAIATMQQVEGVIYVDVELFDAVSEGDSRALADLTKRLDQLATGPPKPRIHVRLARPAGTIPGDEQSSQHGILPAQLCYLTADVPDTLILEQIP